MATRNYNMSVLLVIILSSLPGDSAVTVGTSPQVALQKGSRGLLPCEVQGDVDYVDWVKGPRIFNNQPLVLRAPDDGVWKKRRIDTKYDITGDFSLVILDVDINQEDDYYCTVHVMGSDDFISNITNVIIFAIPNEPYPSIDECSTNANGQINNQSCIIQSRPPLNITCSVFGYYPSIALHFRHQSDKLDTVNSAEWNNTDGTRNKTVTITAVSSDVPYTCVASDIPGLDEQRQTTVVLAASAEEMSTSGNYVVSVTPTVETVANKSNMLRIIVPVVMLSVAAVFLGLYILLRRKKIRFPRQTSNQPRPNLPVETILLTKANAGDTFIPDQVPWLPGQELNMDDIRDKRIDRNFTIVACREALIKEYKHKTCKVHIKPWDRGSVEDVKDIYTVVTMYKKDAHGTNLGDKEKVTLDGAVDEIFRTPVNGILPDRIVVIAGAGKGKTTAVAKMAYDWAYRVQGSAFENLPLLFILRLRNVSHGTSLGQAIIQQLLYRVPDIHSGSLETFIHKNQALCWIILDGLDEYSDTMNHNKEESSNIIKVIKNKELPTCRVLVTTRPHLEQEFDRDELPQIYAKMEIEGFSHENSETYINKFFRKQTATGNELHTYLTKNDVINELVSTPLFCLMICYLWRENRLAGINTQTKLFESVNEFLWQHSKARSEKFNKEWLSKTLHHLGKVALAGLLCDSNKLIFRPEDFNEVPDILGNGCELGIIAITSENEVYDRISEKHVIKKSIEFYHKLAQEHAAGTYLADITSRIKMALNISKLDRVIRDKRKCISSYEHILRFASGRNNDVCIRIMSGLLANRKLEPSEIYRILLDCSSESSGLEGNASSMVQECVSDGAVTLKSPTVYTVVGMNKLPEFLRKEIRSVDIQNPRLTSTLPARLTDAFNSFPRLETMIIQNPTVVQNLPHPSSVACMKLLNIPSNCEDWQWISNVKELKRFHISVRDTEEIRSRGDIADHDSVDDSIAALTLTTVMVHLPATLTELEKSVTRGGNVLGSVMVDGEKTKLTNINDGETTLTIAKVLESLPEYLRQKVTLLEVKYCRLGESSTSMSVSLASLTSLHHLYIESSSLPLPHQSPPSLPSVRELRTKHLTSDSYRGLISSLPGLEKLGCDYHYKIYLTNPDADISQISLGLRHTGASLTEIRLDGRDASQRVVSDTSMRSLCDVIRDHSTRLELIGLYNMTIGEESLVRLVDTCRAITTMREIGLFNLEVQKDGRLMSHLRDLHRSDCAVQANVNGDYFHIPHCS